ncbi:cytochrome P450 [Rhizoctonia solani]|nr:cytochrome P450 [Rhizoctonia solani]
MTLANILAAVVGLALLVRIAYSWMMPKPIPKIPHNLITSVWGDIPAIVKYNKEGRYTVDFIDDMAKMHSPITQILIGRQAMVIISDIREAERLLIDSRVTEQAKRVRQAFAGVSPNSQVSLPTDEAWKRHRRLAGPSMSKRYLQRMSSRISAGAVDLIKLWKAKMDLAGPSAFDASIDIQLSTMDTMGDITMGSSFGCIEATQAALPTNCIQSGHIMDFPRPSLPPLHQSICAMGESIDAAMKAPFPSLHAQLVKYTSPSWRKQYNILSTFLKNAIAEARERENTAGNKEVGLATDADCVLDMIIQREIRDGAEAFGEDAIHDELMSFIFAGQDTSTAVLRWLVKHLAADPEIQRRLHNEMVTVFGPDEGFHEPLDFNLLDDSEQVPLLEAVVAETLRWAGVGAQIARELLQDEIILGRHVPKGTDVVFATALMSRDKTEWGPDADEWQPTRWLAPDGAFNRSAGPSYPFGLGQRACFGQRLAVLELKAYVATMSRHFFFKSIPQDIENWQVKVESFAKQPKFCHVSLEDWTGKQA